jgi:hypothetical protein
MTNTIWRSYEASDSAAGGGHIDNPPRKLEGEAAKKSAGNPGSIADVAGMSGDLDGGGGVGRGTGKDSHLDKGDNGPTPDKNSQEE